MFQLFVYNYYFLEHVTLWNPICVFCRYLEWVSCLFIIMKFCGLDWPLTIWIRDKYSCNSGNSRCCSGTPFTLVWSILVFSDFALFFPDFTQLTNLYLKQNQMLWLFFIWFNKSDQRFLDTAWFQISFIMLESSLTFS